MRSGKLQGMGEREAKRVTMSRFQISCILAEMAAGLCVDEEMGEPMSKWGRWG